MPKTKAPRYEEAIEQIEHIVRSIENDELDIDSLTSELRTAQKLLKLCKDKLTSTEDEVRNILNTK
ncbi:MAG: exodeoxyribonuclease VII small subunit [Prevotella sp.]|nr:exodeoxyribonuclease VII small subunit [Prevotella sp.]MDY5686203.1 exodeoxyribonuclease VII small subunit [Prevotella sp.]